MNILIDIGVYMLASSLVMIGYVWFKDFRHSQLGYDQISESEEIVEETHAAKENLAAA